MLCSLNLGAPCALMLNGKGGFFNNVISIVHYVTCSLFLDSQFAISCLPALSSSKGIFTFHLCLGSFFMHLE